MYIYQVHRGSNLFIFSSMWEFLEKENILAEYHHNKSVYFCFDVQGTPLKVTTDTASVDRVSMLPAVTISTRAHLPRCSPNRYGRS